MIDREARKQQTTGVLTDEQVEAGAKAGYEIVTPGHNYDKQSYDTQSHYRRLVRAAAPHVQYTAAAPARVESTAPVQDHIYTARELSQRSNVIEEMCRAFYGVQDTDCGYDEQSSAYQSMTAALAVARKHESERWQKAITEECESRFHRDFSTPSYLAAILRRLTPQPPEVKRLEQEIAPLPAELHAHTARVEALETKYAFAENQGLCIGYAGGCDGDLEATRHEEDCPARAKDMELRPYLYPPASRVAPDGEHGG